MGTFDVNRKKKEIKGKILLPRSDMKWLEEGQARD